jgi:hypothetical protein
VQAPETWAAVFFSSRKCGFQRTSGVVFGILTIDNLMVVVRVARFD